MLLQIVQDDNSKTQYRLLNTFSFHKPSGNRRIELTSSSRFVASSKWPDHFLGWSIGTKIAPLDASPESFLGHVHGP